MLPRQRELKVNDVLKHKAAGWDQYFCLLILSPHLLCLDAFKICCSWCWPLIITIFILEFISFTYVDIWLSRCFIFFFVKNVKLQGQSCAIICVLHQQSSFMYMEIKALMSYNESYSKDLFWLMQISHKFDPKQTQNKRSKV